MQLELPIRWTEKETEADSEAENVEKLIKGEDYKERDRIKYSYSKLLINANDIGPYYDLDAHNTMINDKLGKVYCVTIPLDQFKKILTEVTGNAIMSIQVRNDEQPTPPRRNPPKSGPKPKQNDDDDILDS